MFAFFNDSKFPKVYVTFNSNINDESWNKFTEKWLSYDKKKIPYTFIFNTDGLGISLITYTQKIAMFMSLQTMVKNIKEKLLLFPHQQMK